MLSWLIVNGKYIISIIMGVNSIAIILFYIEKLKTIMARRQNEYTVIVDRLYF